MPDDQDNTAAPRARERRPRGRGHELHDDLLAAALRVLSDLEDVDQLTMRAVASAAGVTTPSLYRHFEDRTALLHVLFGRGFARFGAAQAAALTGLTDPIERMRSSARAYVEFGIAQPALYRLLFSTRHTGRQIAPASLHPGQRALDELHEHVAACIGPDATPDRTNARAAVLWSTLHGFLELRAGKPDLAWPTAEDLVDIALQPILDAGERPPGSV